MSAPLISVIIPAYNHERYVAETINSIIAQSYENIELLVVNDGSKDSTWQKINELKPLCEKRFKRVVFETQENKGTCETFNKLIQMSKGEYVYIIASDDISKPHALQLQADFLRENNSCALVVGDNEFIDENSTRVYWNKDKNNVYEQTHAVYKTFADYLKKERPEIDFNSQDFGSYKSVLRANYIPNGYLIRKSIFDKTGLFTKDAPLEDYWLMMQIAKHSKMKFIDDILFSYRWHGANTMLQTERVLDMARRTTSHEFKLIKSGYPVFYKIFMERITKRKNIIKIPFILNFYKLKNGLWRELHLVLFGRDFLLSHKKYKDTL